MQSSLRHRAQAQVMPWFLGAVLLVVLSLGLIEDGMVLFAGHRRATLLAEAAARAGASRIDLASMLRDPTAPPVLDVSAAQTTARDYVLRQQPEATVDTSADPQTIVVTVHLQMPPTILHPPGQPTVDVSADGTAHPFVGMATAGP